MTEPGDDVVERARAGDSEALGILFRAWSPRVAGYLRARGAEDPEELTSEVFLQVFRKLGTVHGGVRGLRTFVFSVAHARMVDDVRSRGRRPRPASYDEAHDTRVAPSAESEALDREAAQRAVDLLALLGEEQRAVIALRVIGQLSIEETASALGKSSGAVKQLQRRGLVRLRTLMAATEVTR